MRQITTMEFKQLTYLFLVILLSMTVFFTGPNKIARLRNLVKYILPANFFSLAVYLIWGTRFSQIGIWSFNPEYTTGIQLWNLPLEEWLFLWVVSFLSVAVYEWAKIRFSEFEKPNVFLAISLVLLVIFGLTAFLSRQKVYPFFTFFLLSVYFGYTIFRNRFKKSYTKFYITYLVIIVPIFIIKAILCSLTVVSYNSIGTLGVYIANVPIEDFGYYFLLVLMNLTIFEYLNERRFY